MDDTNQTKLATLFADIAGSTGLYERLGDTAALGLIEGCLHTLKRVTEEFGGRCIKTIGDELMAIFPSAEVACYAATEMQWRATESPATLGEPLAIRIGLHYGAAVEHDGDVFGDSVNVAARLTELANPRQIITSGQTVACLPGTLAANARRLWPLPLKGKTEPIDVLEILWDSGSEATITLSGQFEPPRLPVRMRLHYRGTEVVVDAAHPQVEIGRDLGNAVVVDARNASRVHARVEWRRDKFVLVDLSTNGTYVLDGQNPETRLRREEFILDGDGKISFGRSHSAGAGECVEYYCEYSGGGLSQTLKAPVVHGG
jgi:class 3 adenylate cyclase